MNKRLRVSVTVASLLLLLSFKAQAQQVLSSIPVTDSLMQSGSQKSEGEEEFIKPSRPTLANPAEFQKPGVLQIEYGYDANFRAREFRTSQSAPLALRFAATSRLLIEADFDTVKSETDEMGTRMTGVGDSRLGFQVVALKDTAEHPALAFAYYVKFPSASESKNLGTGRFDHKVMVLLSRKLGAVDMDLNGAYLIVGRENAGGWVTGGQGAISFSGEFKNGFGLQGELSGETKDDVQPRGLFATGAFTYKVNRRLVFDAGMRFGLNPDAPRVGVIAGFTVGAFDFYKK